MSTTLVTAAPGTRLSAAARALGAGEAVVELDVEERLKTLLTADDLRAVNHKPGADVASLTMAVICRAFPRQKVLALWRSAIEACLADVQPGKHNVLVGHLTLYRNDRSEYYSTAGVLLRALTDAGQEVDDVVLLIDDIFDMYEQLAYNTGALNAVERQSRWQQFTAKVSPAAALSADHLGEQLHLETTIQTLNLLVSWRRHESLSAETLATALGARFTVLGIKHERTALERLVTAGDTVRTAYISHPISAYRRSIGEQIAAGESPTWDAAVKECNQLPSTLAEAGQVVAVMPTAIDEMRFLPVAGEATTLTQREPRLGPRWPLIRAGEELIAGAGGVTVTDTTVQHADLIVASHPHLAGDVVSGELTRFLEGLFFIEIPYRDHLLVANCDDLVVFRPLADHGRLSSGVDHEIKHWWDRVQYGDERTRLVVVHTVNDLKFLTALWDGSASWLTPDAALQSRVDAVNDVISLAVRQLTDDEDIEEKQARALLQGRPLQAEQLGGPIHLSDPKNAQKVRVQVIADAVDGFIRRHVGLTRGRNSAQVLVSIIDDNIPLTPRRAKVIGDFLGAANLATVTTAIVSIGDEDPTAPMTRFIESDVILRTVFGVDFAAQLASEEAEAGRALTTDEAAALRAAVATDAAVSWIVSLAGTSGGTDLQQIES